MKRLFVLIAVTLTITAKSQTSVYHPFPDSNAIWSCSGTCDGIMCCCRNLYTYIMSGHDSINGKLYSRLMTYRQADVYYPSCLYHYTMSDSGILFIRQDTALKTIWTYDSTYHIESVLYNFNLNVGDTLDTSKVSWGLINPYPFIISSIDSVCINGNYRKRYNYSSGRSWCSAFKDSSIIEGIGSISGFREPPSCLICGTNALDEFIQNNHVFYAFNGAVCQDSLNGISETKIKNEISIFPNPFHSTAKLQLTSEFENAGLIVYNVLGEKIKELKISSQSTVISGNGLREGIYFFKVINSFGQLLYGKFIVE